MPYLNAAVNVQVAEARQRHQGNDAAVRHSRTARHAQHLQPRQRGERRQPVAGDGPAVAQAQARQGRQLRNRCQPLQPAGVLLELFRKLHPYCLTSVRSEHLCPKSQLVHLNCPYLHSPAFDSG